MLPEWTRQQRAALQVMGIPVWQKKTAKPPVFYYRLGQLYMHGARELPVSLPAWVNDLCLYFEQRPVAVKAPLQTPILSVDYNDWLDEPVSVEQKKALWQKLQNAEL
ncbi:hypothetical protein [Idiomarina aminovorans]|uniref:hypothetical protein n=1 Tax=Idiomarina aminovorans TaxID=2914829 RepID=UPI00200462BC|nr:hypothetical protein [Idiomarina sp. ATCH4]MCK7460418.1 hypothetical protein [Idiomarina sp. ATCH4]